MLQSHSKRRRTKENFEGANSALLERRWHIWIPMAWLRMLFLYCSMTYLCFLDFNVLYDKASLSPNILYLWFSLLFVKGNFMNREYLDYMVENVVVVLLNNLKSLFVFSWFFVILYKKPSLSQHRLVLLFSFLFLNGNFMHR